jgi:hypothetical protein
MHLRFSIVCTISAQAPGYPVAREIGSMNNNIPIAETIAAAAT